MSVLTKPATQGLSQRALFINCHIKHGKQEIGAGVYCPLTDSKHCVEPNSTGITNTICRLNLSDNCCCYHTLLFTHCFRQSQLSSSERKRKTTQAVKTLPTSIKEKRIPRAEAPCIPFTKRNKTKKSMGIRRVTGSSPCLILVTRVERGLLKSASGARKCISVLDRMGMKLQSKPGGCMRVKTKLCKRLQSVMGFIYPEKHKQHIQGDVLETISTLTGNLQTTICVYKVKSHAGIADNEYVDAIANYQANQANNRVADTGIPGAGPGGNLFPHLFWLAQEEKREHTAGTPTAPAPNPKDTYLSNLQKCSELLHAYKTQTWFCRTPNRLRKEKKVKKNYVGRENSSYIN
eukprot:1154513-Pelagomonas_calceolata.AAC.1